MENKIKHFWKCSIENNMNHFDFESFFTEFEKKLKDKLKGHCQLSFEEYTEYIKRFYDIEQLKQFEYISKHTGYKETYKDILFSVFNKRYKMFNKKFKDSENYKKMLIIHSEILNRNDLNRRGKVFLVDKCIDLQHNSGYILNIDIDKLKAEFEDMDCDTMHECDFINELLEYDEDKNEWGIKK